MAVSPALSKILRANLEQVETPEKYESFRTKLMKLKLNLDPPVVKESPENTSALEE